MRERWRDFYEVQQQKVRVAQSSPVATPVELGGVAWVRYRSNGQPGDVVCTPNGEVYNLRTNQSSAPTRQLTVVHP